MSYEANISTQTSILPEGPDTSVIFEARGFGESETQRIAVKVSDGDYTTSSTTIHLYEIGISRINDTVRSLREAADAIEKWNTIRPTEEDR